MKLRFLAVIGLIIIGVGAIGFAVIGPGLGSSATTQYLTATATRGNVVAQSVATGSVVASATYGLAFGSQPQLVASSTTSSAGGTGSWLVKSVAVAVGDRVTNGQVLAVADSTSVDSTLAVANAGLASAKARLATDKAGLSTTDKSAAAISITQAQNQVAQAQRNVSITAQQNALKLSQATAALTRAQAAYATDMAANAPSDKITGDLSAITSAQDQLASLKLQLTSSANSASDQLASARLSLKSAQLSYASRTASTAASTIASDQASIANAQESVRVAALQVDAATLTAPADGIVTTVGVVAGVLAPSGSVIQLQVGPMQVTSSFAESDIGKLKVGQTTSVTVAAAGATIDGTVSQITPTASSSTSGTSVVTYAVRIALPKAPTTVLAGMTASIAVTTAQAANVIAVPAIALVGSAGAYGVRVIAADGTSQVTSVDVGLVTTSLAEIKTGLSEGDTVSIGTVSARTSTSASTNTGVGIPGVGGGGGGGGFGRGNGN